MTIRGSRTDPFRNWEPDAGATFLGAYGLRNPMVLWLLRKHPELLAFTPGEIARGAQAPYCAVDHRPAPMLFRRDGWYCYRHSSPRRPLWLRNGPAVIWVSDFDRFRSGFQWGDHGYLPVYRDRSLRAWRAVWPLPLWAVHVVGHGAWLFLWGAVGLLWRHGLVRFESRENDLARLRDLRFGREW